MNMQQRWPISQGQLHVPTPSIDRSHSVGWPNLRTDMRDIQAKGEPVQGLWAQLSALLARLFQRFAPSLLHHGVGQAIRQQTTRHALMTDRHRQIDHMSIRRVPLEVLDAYQGRRLSIRLEIDVHSFAEATEIPGVLGLDLGCRTFYPVSANSSAVLVSGC